MEGFPLALVAENTLIPELLVGGNLECIKASILVSGVAYAPECTLFPVHRKMLFLKISRTVPKLRIWAKFGIFLMVWIKITRTIHRDAFWGQFSRFHSISRKTITLFAWWGLFTQFPEGSLRFLRKLHFFKSISRTNAFWRPFLLPLNNFQKEVPLKMFSHQNFWSCQFPR